MAPSTRITSLRSIWRRNSPHSLDKVQPIETRPMDDRSAQAVYYLQDGCPPEVLPLILAFCGPQQTMALARVSKSWNALVNNERTFRVLCEELYKVSQ
jgi:F-box domain